MILEATAEKEAQIARAEGEAEALRLVYEAQAKGIEYINSSQPQQAYITLEGFKALENLAKGESTKIIIPTDLQGMAGAVTSIAEIVKDPKKQ